MTIKSLRWHSVADISRKVIYIFSDRGRARIEDPVIYQNVQNQTEWGAIEALLENDEFRAENAKRKNIKNSVVLYEHIFSFSPKDRDKVTKEMLIDFCEKAISLVASDAVVVAKLHMHNENPHAHLLVSGSNYLSYELTRLDNKAFKEFRKAMEKYQKQKYPELKNSLVYDNLSKDLDYRRREKNKSIENEYQAKKHNKKPLEKDLLRKQVIECYERALDKIHFLELIKQTDLKNYTRKIGGVDQDRGIIHNNKRYKYSSLLGKERFEKLENTYKKDLSETRSINDSNESVKRTHKLKLTRKRSLY